MSNPPVLPHRIRLRGPWQITTAAQPALRALKLPEQFPELAKEIELTLTRSFGWQAPLAAHERVWLVVEGLTQSCPMWLNDHGLAELQPAAQVEIDITPLLRQRNELRIEFSRGGGWEELAVEVRAKAWLADLEARRRADRVVVCGCIRGTAEEPLDLYAIMNRRTIIQHTIGPGHESDFELTSEPLPSNAWDNEVEIELVCGAAVWHQAMVPVTRS